MRTIIGIITFIIVAGTSVSVATEAQCQYSKDSKGYLLASCAYNDLQSVPDNIMPDVQTLNLEHNYIGTLTNESFAMYPNIRRLRLSFNQVHTIEPGALSALGELEMLDLSNNAVKEVPAGLPKSLQKLYLNGNPVAVDMHRLAAAVGLHALHLRSGTAHRGLDAYPELGLLPNLVDLDVSQNRRIADVSPAQLAATCRLAHLNVTGTALFPAGAHCRCRRFVRWTADYRIAVTGLDACPEPVPDEGAGGGDDDPGDAGACERAPDAARAAFKACMAEWEHRNTPYWAIAGGLVIAAAVVWLLLCVCVRRRKRRRRADNKAQAVPPSDTKDGSNDLQATAAAAAAAAQDLHKTAAEPAALLSS